MQKIKGFFMSVFALLANIIVSIMIVAVIALCVVGGVATYGLWHQHYTGEQTTALYEEVYPRTKHITPECVDALYQNGFVFHPLPDECKPLGYIEPEEKPEPDVEPSPKVEGFDYPLEKEV